MQFHCETCNATRLSVLEYENGKHTWLCCVTLCLVAGAMAFLPFYLKECKDLTHYCPSCSSKVMDMTIEGGVQEISSMLKQAIEI